MTKTTAHRKTSGFLGFQARIVIRGIAGLGSRSMLRALFCGVLVTAGALEAIRFGAVERPQPLATAYHSNDPVVASVGREVLRVSDAFAHAAFIGEDVELESVPALIASGTVDDAANHLALAQAAREAGVDEALEIRAAVALAERQILAEAYLDQVARRAVTEEAILARYEAERDAVKEDNVLRLSEIVVATREEALALAKRLPRNSFASLAQKHSIAATTKGKGGLLGEVREGDLDPAMAEALTDIGIGGVTEPFETEAGWHLVKLESRRALRLPPLRERREAIAEALKQEAIAAALEGARVRAPLRVRSAQAIAADGSLGLAGSLANARSIN